MPKNKEFKGFSILGVHRLRDAATREIGSALFYFRRTIRRPVSLDGSAFRVSFVIT